MIWSKLVNANDPWSNYSICKDGKKFVQLVIKDM